MTLSLPAKRNFANNPHDVGYIILNKKILSMGANSVNLELQKKSFTTVNRVTTYFLCDQWNFQIKFHFKDVSLFKNRNFFSKIPQFCKHVIWFYSKFICYYFKFQCSTGKRTTNHTHTHIVGNAPSSYYSTKQIKWKMCNYRCFDSVFFMKFLN